MKVRWNQQSWFDNLRKGAGQVGHWLINTVRGVQATRGWKKDVVIEPHDDRKSLFGQKIWNAAGNRRKRMSKAQECQGDVKVIDGERYSLYFSGYADEEEAARIIARVDGKILKKTTENRRQRIALERGRKVDKRPLQRKIVEGTEKAA